MILLRCGGRLYHGFPHANLHELEKQSPGMWALVLTSITLLLLAGLILFGHWIGIILKRQSEPHMKFIYQLYPWGKTNHKPSIVEQTEEQAIKTAKELSIFYGCLVVVRYPDDKGILCIAEHGELTELDTLKTLKFI